MTARWDGCLGRGLIALAVGASVSWLVLAAPDAGGRRSPETGLAASVDVSARLDAYLRQATARREFNGTVLIARGGRILLRKAYGWADLRQRRPNRVRTRFRISSLSTDVMFVSLLQLVDRGRLDLDDSLCKHIEPCPSRWRPITVRLLIDGRSGLPSARPLPRRTRTISEWIAELGTKPLAFHPGKGRDRSEAGMLVGAHLVQAISRTPWPRYLERSIFRPAGMRATARDRAGLPGRATPYVRRRGGRLGAPASFAPLSEPDVLYGLASTVDDMYRFERARRSGALVSRRLLEQIEYSGGGARARAWPDHFAHLGHGPRGTSDGWYTALVRDAEEKLTIVAFSNMGGFSLSDVVHRIRLIAAGWPPARAPAEPTVLARAAGEYFRWDSSKRRRVTTSVRTRPDGTLELSSDEPAHPGSSNSALRNARWRWVLAPTADGAFYATGEELWWGIRVHFEPGTAPNDDVLVVSFVSFGPQRRYRRSS
jgi:CubicO group peptidase (beta-lactamase class C family)